MLNGGAHHSLEVEAELRIRPSPSYFKDWSAQQYNTDARHYYSLPKIT
jgi:hypothetical protein